MPKKKTKLEKTVEKQKKSHPIAFLLVVSFLVIGAFGGWFATKYITRNDTFEIVGEQTITLNLGENYVDEGAVAVAFGKDISNKIVVETNIDNSVAGKYYIKYTVKNLRFGGVVKYRYIIFQEVTNE